LPNDPDVFSKGDYFGLTVLFAAITAVSGILFSVVGAKRMLQLLVVIALALWGGLELP
jgi:hypothetical protein